jgi:hypothetical protein
MPEKMGLPFFLMSAILFFLIIPMSYADPLTGQNSTLELKYDGDSSSYDFYSMTTGGHAVYFDNPGSITITGIKIFGRMYGNTPEKQIHVRIWDKNFNNLFADEITYKEFPQDEAGWITIPVYPFSRTGDFYVAVFTESSPRDSADGGVSIGYDTSTKSGHSHTVTGGGLNNKKVQDINIGPNKEISQSMIDWKIRILYSQSPTALTSTAPAGQQQGTPSSLLPVVAILVIAVACIVAFGYYKYRQKSGIPVPPSPALFPQLPSPQGHHDVFISYAHVDKPVADAVCAKLETNNIRCWIAPRDVSPGKNFPEAIIEGIEGSKIMVIIFSSHSNTSEHVIREATTAINKSLLIIPFRIEDVMPSKSMEYLIGTPHWLDAISPPLDQHLDTLVNTIKKFLSDNKPGN